MEVLRENQRTGSNKVRHTSPRQQFGVVTVTTDSTPLDCPVQGLKVDATI